jgi:hypothetical protein
MPHRALLPFLCCLLLLGLSACMTTLHVGPLDPKPNVNLGKSQATLSLKLGDRVQDAYTVPRENGVGPTEVTQWRASLKAAFKNAFADSFTLADDGGDLVLEVQEAEVAMVPAAVTSGATVVSGRAQIRYKAQLLDKSGKTLARAAATVESKTTASSMSGASSIAKSAMETMFEALVDQLFSQGGKGGAQSGGAMMDSR